MTDCDAKLTGGGGLAVRLRGAVCLRGAFPALTGVNLNVDEGEAVLLRGPNGAGKSTLLRLCAGLAALRAGEGEVLGYDLRTESRSVRLEVGLVAHHMMLYEDLTVVENLEFWARLSGASANQAHVALRSLGVEERLHEVKLRKLSAGQRKRVSVAAVAMRRPRLWLLDEPHAGLDASGREALNEMINLARRSGATVLIASHEGASAEAVATRTIHLAGGAVWPSAPSTPDPWPATQPTATPSTADPSTAAQPKATPSTAARRRWRSRRLSARP